MSERNVLKLDIDSLTKFQEELHSPDKNLSLEELKKKENQVRSRFTCKIRKHGWCAHTKVKMIHSAEEGEVIYTASKKFDVLFKSECHINLIPIKVKDKYRKTVQICYPHNPGHNICYEAELKIDDDHQQGFDSVWLDIYSQFFMKKGAGKKEHYDRMVGNIPCLENWGTDLPGIKLIVPQPYFYARDTRVALKTLRSSMNTITHHYKIRNKIPDILRMRVRRDEDSPWVKTQCRLKYLDIPGNSKELPIPELWARHCLMTDAERDWYKLPDPITGEPRKHVVYTEDIVIATSNNPTALGSTDVIPLHCKSPAKGFFWVAQNIDAINNKNFSNYTTDLDDLFNGHNPCDTIDLKYGGAHRVEKLSHEHFDLSEPWDFYPSAPSEPGYNSFTFGFDPTTLNVDTAIVLEHLHASLHIKLDNTDPFRSIEDPDEEYVEDGELIPVEALGDTQNSGNEKSRYLIHVRALVYKKLEISWNEKAKCLKYLIVDDATKE